MRRSLSTKAGDFRPHSEPEWFSMAHPAGRVLALLELLQTYGRSSGPELAARLEVDRRTVRHYVATLQDLGIPVVSDRGRAGGYRLRPGFKLPPLMFSDDEALVVTPGPPRGPALRPGRGRRRGRRRPRQARPGPSRRAA